MIFTTPIVAGTIASILHVISGPDHLAAITPLVIEEKRKAWRIGLSWGFGHLLGMLLIGVLFTLFKGFIPIQKISEHSEQLVGIVLIGVGFWAFYRIFRKQKTHQHPHIHVGEESYIHIHKHQHIENESHQHVHKKNRKQNIISSFGIGFLHGLAGVAHFLLLLPALSFKTNAEGIQYILGFAIGTVLAMFIYALIISKIVKLTKQTNDSLFFKGIRFVGALFAVVIGFYWLFLAF